MPKKKVEKKRIWAVIPMETYDQFIRERCVWPYDSFNARINFLIKADLENKITEKKDEN